MTAQENFRDMIAAWRRGDIKHAWASYSEPTAGARATSTASAGPSSRPCATSRAPSTASTASACSAAETRARPAIVRADAARGAQGDRRARLPLAPHPFYKCAVHEVRVTMRVATFEGRSSVPQTNKHRLLVQREPAARRVG